MRPAVEIGRVCAVAGQSQREMSEWAAAYPALFSAKPFDSALFGTLALATAFSGPWLDSGQQRMANRTTLWCFGLDWLMDYVAADRAEAAGIAERCLAVADGAAPADGDELTVFLADIRAELEACEAYPVLGPIWRDELRRMLAAMVREHDWKAQVVALPTLAEYLDNADNLGFSFVFAAHWTSVSPPSPAADIAAVRAASWAVQRVIRLLNDLATYDRDVQWGDLNALLLGPTRTELDQRAALLAAKARDLTGALRLSQPSLAEYMERQMDFCAGFYGVTDYWGAL
jgi:hypothetical protein